MSQSGKTAIQLYYSTTAGHTPTAGNLQPGELAFNIPDARLFYKDNAGVVQTLSTGGGGDASTVSYNEGGTGAVTRTVASKLKEVVSVKDFGAVGDGTTDDTAAIQAAINSLSTQGGGVLRLPAGTYKVTANLNITWPNGADQDTPSRMTIEGEGADISYIYDYRSNVADATGGCISMNFSASPGSRFFTANFGGFSIIKKVNATTYTGGVYSIGTGTGLYLNTVPNVGEFYDMRIIGYNIGIECLDCLGMNFTNLNVQLADLGITAKNVAFSEPTQFNFNNCTLAGIQSLAYSIIGGGPVRFDGGIIETVGSMTGGTQPVSGGIYYQNTGFLPTGLVVNGCYFENVAGNADIYIDTPTGVPARVVDSISNCMFARNSNTIYTTNNIFVNNNSSSATNTVITIGNGFKGFSPYVASSSRKYISDGGSNPGSITIYGLANFYDSTTETPTVVTEITSGGGGSYTSGSGLQLIGSQFSINPAYSNVWTATQTVSSGGHDVNLGIFSSLPAVTTTGTQIALGTSTNAVALSGAAWQGAGDAINDLGTSGVRWSNLYLKNNFYWNGYNIAPPGGSTTTFLRNDGTWAAGAGGSYTAGNGLQLIGSQFSIDPAYSNVWTANQTVSSGGYDVNLGIYASTPAVVTTGTSVGFANSTNAVALTGAAWVGAGDAANDLGTVANRWSNLYIKNSMYWNSYPVAAPSGGTTTFLRNDGTWAIPSGSGSYLAGNGLTLTGSTFAINPAYSNTWTANQTISSGGHDVNIGIYASLPAVVTTGTSVGLANGTNAVALSGAAWQGAGDATNDLGTSGARWSNLYLKNNLTWNGYSVAAPSGSTTTFLRNDGTWAAVSGSGTVTSVTAGSGLSGGTITTSGTISLNTGNANTWSATQIFSTVQTGVINANGGNIALANTVFVAPGTGFAPAADNAYLLGAPSFRWTTVYATTGTINTSDAADKQQIADLTEAELRVAGRIRKLIKTFKFNDAVAKKGNDARIHVGVIAQEVQAAFEAESLDANKYGLFCSDVLDDGTTKLGIRYEELLAFVIAAI